MTKRLKTKKPVPETYDCSDDFFREARKLHSKGELEAAARLYVCSIERKPSALAHTMLGRILVQFGEIECAIEECRIATQLDPDFGPALNDLGLYLIEKRHYAEAGVFLERAVKARNSDNREFPHFNLARIYIHQGMLRKATEELQTAIKINPQFAHARDFLNQVQSQLH